jgi:ribosomal protein S21
MGNLVRVRIEVNPKEEDRDIAFRKMFTIFKKVCSEVRIAHTFREHETYESKSRKKRRKSREAEITRMKTKLRENFLVTREAK